MLWVQWVSEALFPGIKRPGAWSYTFIHPYVLMASYLVTPRDNFVFTLIFVYMRAEQLLFAWGPDDSVSKRP